MHITDSHNHLHFHSFHNDLLEVMGRSRASGVETMLLVGIDPHDSEKALDVSLMNEDLFVSIGIHPQKADK
jgi:TatD DNase family protein